MIRLTGRFVVFSARAQQNPLSGLAQKIQRLFDGGKLVCSELSMSLPISRLGRQLEEAIATLGKLGARP